MDSDDMGAKVINCDRYRSYTHRLIVCSRAICYRVSVGNIGRKREKVLASLNIDDWVALFIGAIQPDGVIPSGDRGEKGLQGLVIAGKEVVDRTSSLESGLELLQQIGLIPSSVWYSD